MLRQLRLLALTWTFTSSVSGVSWGSDCADTSSRGESQVHRSNIASGENSDRRELALSKTSGDAVRVPRGVFLLLLSVSFFSLLPSSWLPLIYSPFHSSWTMQRTNVATD